MTLQQHLDRAKIALSDAYAALEQTQQQAQAVQHHLRQCELQKIACEAQVQAYQRVLEEPLALVEKAESA